MDIEHGMTMDLTLDQCFTESALPLCTEMLDKLESDAEYVAWRSLAPGVIENPRDAALYLCLATARSPDLESVRESLLRWWVNRGRTPKLLRILDQDERQALDTWFHRVMQGGGWRLLIREYLLPEPTTQAEERPSWWMSSPLYVSVLPRATSVAMEVMKKRPRHRIVKQAEDRMWDRPWDWLIVHYLAQVAADPDMRRAVVQAIRGGSPVLRAHRDELSMFDADLASRIANLLDFE